ncbi:hypothetical protein, partial [Jatrophihabitans sp.]|uniref:hypothetical protein n=1 Tax=Jatrophihabitans sp. TaxID=1932789 RepID=UPI002CDE5A00|nr:hypothetical protein [Jatrophihabitans sp.]
ENAMRRKSFDALVSTAGFVMAAVLLTASGLLFWAHSFIDDNVRSQLVAEKIFFPPAGSDALKDPAVGPYLNKYAGQQLTTGDQAKAYADHFIAVHLSEIGGGKTYAQLSAQAQANPDDAKLAGQVQTMFRGETLRGLLLNAYAFDTMGTIAGIAAVVAYLSAAVLLVLGLLGLRHSRRVPVTEEILTRQPDSRGQELATA